MSVDTGAVTATYGALASQDFHKDINTAVVARSQVNGTFGVPILGVTVGVNFDYVTKVKQSVTYMTEADALASGAAGLNLLGANSPHAFDEPFGPTMLWHRYPGGISGTALTETTFAKIKYNTALRSTLSTLGLDNLIRNALDSTTGSIIEDIGSDVVDPLLGALGIAVAGADGRMLDVQCGIPALANRD